MQSFLKGCVPPAEFRRGRRNVQASMRARRRCECIDPDATENLSSVCGLLMFLFFGIISLFVCLFFYFFFSTMSFFSLASLDLIIRYLKKKENIHYQNFRLDSIELKINFFTHNSMFYIIRK